MTRNQTIEHDPSTSHSRVGNFLNKKRFTTVLAAAVGVAALAGCAPTHAAPSTTPTEIAPSVTYQQEIAKGLEARPTTGVSINVANYPNLDAAGKAWSDAYFNCLYSGNIVLSDNGLSQYIAAGGDIKTKIPVDFKLDQNWKTCTSNLFDTTEAATAVNTAAEGQNTVIVLNQALGTSETADNQSYQTLSYGGDGKSISFNTQYTITEGSKSGQSEIGGILSNQGGVFKYTNHL